MSQGPGMKIYMVIVFLIKISFNQIYKLKIKNQKKKKIIDHCCLYNSSKKEVYTTVTFCSNISAHLELTNSCFFF